MKLQLNSITRDEKSYNVNLLHKTLEALGHPVSKKEVSENKAGKDTQKKIRSLKTQLNLPAEEAEEGDTIVDEITSSVIADALKSRGLTTASRSFTVSGTVLHRRGKTIKRQKLIAFDVDLKGAGIHRDIQTITDIQKNGGFEFLGKTISDRRGNYQITFYDWQYKQAERNKADVVVYAVEGDTVIGRSGMVHSEDYSETGLVRNLNVTITREDERTEYEALMQRLNTFLEESDTTLDDIIESRDQLAFTAKELDVEQFRINIVARARLLIKEEKKELSHELLYGIGRQNIRLSWPVLYKKKEEELRNAIAMSVSEQVIRTFKKSEINAFLKNLLKCSEKYILDDKENDDANTLNSMLKNALPEEKQRLSFVNSLHSFKGNDFKEFWNEHLPHQPEFKDNPELVSSLLLTQQLTLLSGNYQALVNELQVNRKINSVRQLIDLEKNEWIDIIKETGTPDFIEGENNEESAERYAGFMENLLNAAFPTMRIAKMVGKNELPIEKTKISKNIHTFLSRHEEFDFAGSRIHDFENEIKADAGEGSDAVKTELMKIQRVFQISTSPDAMKTLMENDLHSAHTIAEIPRKNFVNTYSDLLGGKQVAFSIHQRASHISTKAEFNAMHLREYSHGLMPKAIMNDSERKEVMEIISEKMPDSAPSYSDLFGSPDVCECEHCRSVYSPSAYFVDLLRYLWRGEPNSNGESPLDVLTKRRPDLLHLQLTCENSNTLIPYIDLANEVMEYYTANDSLTDFEGYDTGETTPEELRANPQHFDLEAYRRLKDAKYPFSLPYHQPLDLIRTYTDHLEVSRFEVMKAVNPEPDTTPVKAIDAESLTLSPEEYAILTGEDFDGTEDTTSLHEYFGFTAAGQLENLSEVREFLKRSGVAYADLVELIKTRFINPYQSTLDFLEKIFSYAAIDANAIYTKLEQIEAGTIHPSDDPDITAAITAYNSNNDTDVTAGEFEEWVNAHLEEFRQVITLYEPESKCDLDTTWLRTIQSIYGDEPGSGIQNDTWSKMHRFIRLWRKLGWSIHETDLVLAALGEDDITVETIRKLKSISLLQKDSKRPLNQLAVMWGTIDTDGDKSLYKKLFLNKAVQEIDKTFKADAWGNYLQNDANILESHESSIVAAFGITEKDLEAILDTAQVIDSGNPRNLDMASDKLNIQNLSTLYRYVILAKSLKMKIPGLCKLISLFGNKPFSTWDIDQEKFVDINPDATYEFYQLADSVKSKGFKPSELEYILTGALPVDSNKGIDESKSLRIAKDIRDAFTAIEQEHPEASELTLTTATVAAKLSLTFQPEIVNRFVSIIEGTADFEAITDDNLDITIPEELAGKYIYVNGSGRLICTGIMSDAERDTLKGLPGVNPNFEDAVEELYEAPETFINENFNGIFPDGTEAIETLVGHPSQPDTADLDAKLLYIYKHFLPVLKEKLRKDSITQHIASLIDLSEAATQLIIAEDLDTLVRDLSDGGFSAGYFSDAAWATNVLNRTDRTIDFSWETNAPDTVVPADNFSVRWEAYIVAPASDDYTLIVDVEEADEAFKLYLDGTLILEKASGDADTSLEAVAGFNAGRMHLLTLEYAEISQKAGIRLRWKTATRSPETIPASAAYPADILNSFVKLATEYHRAAKFILEFELSETELNHFLTYKVDFANIDFKALEADHWKRVNDYTTLRNNVPQARALLTDVFALANRPDPLPGIGQLTEKLHQATPWDKTSLEFLVNIHFSLAVDDFKNEVALQRLHDVMKIVAKTGISAQTLVTWGMPETDFDVLHQTAQTIKNIVKAKYEEEEWLDLAGNLSDIIRKNEQQALVRYLLVQPEIRNAGVKDADGLFEYFLIDVQMGSCMDTSRIVQANAAIQLFVNRCLLNLESDTSGGPERGVSPRAIDKERWEWMKNYRVWEANRKVFLCPENCLEPERRNNRSPFFKELESYLVQNDITERSVEEGFRKYLANLNAVANLEVCGMYQENYDKGQLKHLHVFARTHNAPYSFFYRRMNKYRKWSAWEEVSADIRSVEEGDDSGIHLIPVVWKKRLFLFWPEFIEAQESPENGRQTVREASDNTISELESEKHWEIRLAWSEYVDGKWNPKQLTKEFIESRDFNNVKGYTYRTTISPTTQSLSIKLQNRSGVKIGEFRLSDIQSKVKAIASISGDSYEGDPSIGQLIPFMIYAKRGKSLPVSSANYTNNFMKREKKLAALDLLDDMYLQKRTDHQLLNSNHAPHPDDTLEVPFFFSDSGRTYFVRPVDIRIIEGIKYPGSVKPYLTEPDDPILYRDQPERNPSTGNGEITRYSNRMRMRLAEETDIATNSITSPSKVYGMEIGSLSDAFAFNYGKVFEVGNYDSEWLTIRYDKGLEFHTFYHPYSSDFVKHLNQGGMRELLESDTEEILSDDGAMFEDEYDPNFTNGFVQGPSQLEDFDKRTYYKENVCFDEYGANSIYNWELFYHAPLYIATRLSKNGKYAEAMKWFHHIFDPTTDEMPAPGDNESSRYWKVLPFKKNTAKSLEEWFRDLSPNTDPTNAENSRIGEWRDSPFDPHLVASNRPLAYMKHVVIKYVENLVAWGDSLFRQFTRESVYEALQLYVMANHTLGEKPEFVPRRGKIKAESYDSLRDTWDDFSNTLVQLENLFPYSSEVSVDSSSSGTNLLGIGSALYFCIPENEKLHELWNTVSDRLYKIRHCQDIDGVERYLALFAPPISRYALLQAESQGLSLGSILADLSSPPPIYRFSYLIQKANEFCADVKGLGSSLLAALEKKDAEELSRMRASHETQMLELMTSVKERQVLDAKAYKENLLKARETAEFRLQHYLDLLGNEDPDIPSSPTIQAELDADSPLPADTRIGPFQTDVDDSLVDNEKSGVKLIGREAREIALNQQASDNLFANLNAELLAGFMGLIPQSSADGKPLGVGAGVEFGGRALGWYAGSVAKMFSTSSQINSMAASKSAKMASYIRREQDWTLQANLAANEIIQLDKQITSADIRIQVAEKELDNHKQQIENSEEVELFLEDKFTNQELYQWMKEQLFSVYKQSYNLAHEMAKKAEKAYQYELGTETTNLIQYGNWDNSRQGLVAGEKLQLALRQLEKSYMEDNRRELELSKSISMALLNPLALIELKETGKCYLSLPEELFDLDFQGHYFRRIKSVSISIPCVAGPYTTVNCSLRLLKNSIRTKASLYDEGNYEHKHDEGVWKEDNRFRSSNVPVTSIATSTGQTDSGMFEFNFRDERYLPFERAGAISDWKIELSTEKELRQFDYSTISDVILHLNYTARENGGIFKEKAVEHIKNFMKNAAELSEEPLMRMIHMKQEFPTEWHQFLHPADNGEQILKFIIGKDRFPFFALDREISVRQIDVFVKCTQSGDYNMVLSHTDGEDTATSSEITTESNNYGELNKATIDTNGAGLNLEDLDIMGEMSLKIKHQNAQDYTGLTTSSEQDEVEDIFLVIHYHLDDA